MNLGLLGKKVLITGASQGIGASMALKFLQEGADVFIISRGSKNLYKTEKNLRSKFGKNRIFASKCDCGSISELNYLKKKINKKMKKIDIVIANVGDGRSVPDILPKQQQWDKIWKKNFSTALNTARVFLPNLTKNKGSILFISSIAGLESIGAPVDYSTAKTALISLAKNLSKKLKEKVRVNVIAPGNIYFSGGSWEKKMKKNSAQIKNYIQKVVPMNRFGKPEEVADAALFISSERAKFITGNVLTIDGGQTSKIL